MPKVLVVTGLSTALTCILSMSVAITMFMQPILPHLMPACAGIARVVTDRVDCASSAGLREDIILDQLLWYVQSVARRYSRTHSLLLGPGTGRHVLDRLPLHYRTEEG